MLYQIMTAIVGIHAAIGNVLIK